MSAIAGVMGWGDAPPDVELARAMLERMAHRGPDGRCTWAEGPVAFGEGRFATTTHAAAEPLPDSTNTHRRRVVADVRLDNRAELAAELEVELTSSDADLILAAYVRWGTDAPRHLVGDFAFALWDPVQRLIFAARDHFGVRSLYYHLDRRGVRIASDIDALFADPSVPRRPNARALALFLSEDFVQRDETLYEAIRAVPPAHSLTIKNGCAVERPYWHPDPWKKIRYADPADYARQFADTLKQAVRCRVDSSTPLACQISGGFDSSCVAAHVEVLRREGIGPAERPTLLHSSFPGLACDEKDFVDAVAERWGLEVTKLLPPGREATEPAPARIARDVYYHPLGAIWDRQFQEARDRGARVILGGFGADQVMQRTGRECAEALVGGRILEAARIARGVERPGSTRTWRRFAREGIQPLLPRNARAAIRWARRSGPLLPAWFSPAAARDVTEHRSAMDRYVAELPAPGPASRALCADLTHGYQVLFGLAALATHAPHGGVELRHPFYDIRLVETLLSFPHAARCGIDERKPLLKHAATTMLPDIVRARPRGAEFTPYAHKVLFDDHGAAVSNLLESSRLADLNLVDGTQVRELFRAGKEDWSLIRQVANLTALEVWLRQIDEA